MTDATPAPTNDDCVGALEALTQLSRIGAKKMDLLKRHALMIRWCREALKPFHDERDTLTMQHVKTDENGRTVLRKVANGETPEYEDEFAFQMALNQLLKKPADVARAGKMPEPFTWDELTQQFKKQPDALVLAMLGPFATLD